MLLFKKKFLDAIRRGEKTQTIRLWKRRMMKAGQRSYIPGVGYIRIHTVEPVALAALTDDDARPDGFTSAAELREEIARLYQAGTEQQAYRVVFEVLPPDEQETIRQQRAAEKAEQKKNKAGRADVPGPPG